MNSKVYKNYDFVTEDERTARQLIWVSVLDTYCKADEVGNRPCDWGCPCDKCHYDYNLYRKYILLLLKLNMPVTEDELKKYVPEEIEPKLLLVVDREPFIDKYELKIWNGDKVICTLVSETEDTITVRGHQSGILEDYLVEKEVDKKDIIKIQRDTEPSIQIIVIE